MKNVTKRAISVLLSVLMIVTMIPIGVLGISAASDNNYVKIESGVETDYGFLGRTFNALNKSSLSSSSDLEQISVFDYADLEAYISGDADKGVLQQGGTAKVFYSAKEAMDYFGIETSSSLKGEVGMAKAKAGFEVKFSTSVDHTVTNKTEEIFYYYVYRAECENYQLKTYSDYSKYLSDDFLSAISDLNTKISSNSKNTTYLKNFFDTYGTHVLVQYDRGAQMTFTASAVYTSANEKMSESLSTEINASASYGAVSVGTANSIANNFKKETSDNSVRSETRWNTLGGDTSFRTKYSGDSISIDENGLDAWLNSINGGNAVFIPETSKWVNIWDIIPNESKYDGLRKALYEYYVETEYIKNTEFFGKYITASDYTSEAMATYINPDGYISKIAYKTNTNVAPGSVIKVELTAVEDYNSVEYKVISGEAEVDRNGVVKILDMAYENDNIIVQAYGDGLPIATLTFNVKNEGNNGAFAGGYGDRERPYLVGTSTQLNNIRNYASAKTYFVQIRDITLSGRTWTSIPMFSATYDGNGYAIQNFTVNSTSVGDGNKVKIYNAGFIGINAGTVKNLTFSNITINCVMKEDSKLRTCLYIGTVAGENRGVIQNCVVDNARLYGELNDIDNNKHAFCDVGGLVGNLSGNGKISRCAVNNSSMEVYMGCSTNSSDNNYGSAAGIVGLSDGGYIDNVLSKFNTMKSSVYCDGRPANPAYPEVVVGGVIGKIWKENGSAVVSMNNAVSYRNSMSTHSKKGNYTKPYYYDGEIIGYLKESSDDYIYDCYSDVSDSYVSSTYLYTSLSGNSNWTFDSSKAIPSLNSIKNVSIVKNPKTEYIAGDILDVSGLTVKAYGENSAVYDHPLMKLTTDMDVINSVGQKDITLRVGEFDVYYTVNVSPAVLESIQIKEQPSQTEYYVGDKNFNLAGLNVEAIYSNGSRKNVTYNVTISGFDTSEVSENKTLILTYTEKDISVTTELNISVSKVLPFKMEILTLPKKVNYAEGEKFDGTGCKVKVYYNNRTSKIISDGLTFEGFDGNLTGTQAVTVKYYDVECEEGVSATFDVNIGTIKSIAIKTMPTKTQYYVGDSKYDVDGTGLVLTVTYSNGVKVDVDSGYTLSRLNATIGGTWETVTVSLFDKQTSYQVYINPIELVSIEIDRLPNTSYYVGDEFNSLGLRIKATYNNGDYKLKQASDCELLIGNASAEGYVFGTSGKKTVSVDYYENGKNASVSFDVNAVAIKLDRLEIAKQPTKIAYKAGESIDTAGMVINAIYNNGDIVDITNSIDSIVCDMTTAGEKQAVVWYNNITATFDITVMSPSYISVTALPYKTTYNYGEEFDYRGMEVTAYYPDGSNKLIDDSEYTVSTDNSENPQNVMVTVSYNDKHDSFYVTVKVPSISVSAVPACAGQTVEVTVSLENNPGVLGALLKLDYNENLILESVETGDAFSTLSYTAPGTLSNPCGFGWDGIDAADTNNGIILKLTFKVSADAKVGDSYEINVSYDEGSIFDGEMKALDFAVTNGSVEIIDYKAGDLNDDGVVNMQDIVLLRRYTVGGYDVEINTMAADVNRDGSINMLDVVLIRRYVVGGYGVELL